MKLTGWYLRKWKAILGKGWDEWYACSAGFTGRTPHYSSIIDYLFILYDTSLALCMITSQCFGPNKPSFSCINQWEKKHRKKTNKHTDNFLNWAACPAKVPWNILFMLVSWWCKSEKLWDVLFKHTYACRETLYLHSGGVFHRDQCALNSQTSTDVWQRVEMLGLKDQFSLTLLWLWRQGHQVKGGKRKVGQGREGESLLNAGYLDATPAVNMCVSISVFSLHIPYQ